MSARLLTTLTRSSILPLPATKAGLQPLRTIFFHRPQQPQTTALVSMDKFWKDIGSRIKKFDEDMKSVASTLSNNGQKNLAKPTWSQTWPFSPEVYRTLFAVPEVEERKDGKKYYKIEIPIGKQFVPDNVKIVMKNYHLTVTAVVEDKSPDGRQHFYTEIKRQITLPDYIDLENVKSLMGEDGVLRIDAPVLPGIDPPSSAKEIPIKHLE